MDFHLDIHVRVIVGPSKEEDQLTLLRMIGVAFNTSKIHGMAFNAHSRLKV